MPSLVEIATARRVARRATADTTVSAATRLWATRVDRARVARSWLDVVPLLAAVVAAAQLDAASGADGYVAAALARQGIDTTPVATVNPRAFSGVASDGRRLDTLLFQPALTALGGLGRGDPPGVALAAGAAALRTIVDTQVVDAGRVADLTGAVTRRQATGYVRMLVPPSCSRCAILAGRFYRWNTGFDRHPWCDCVHVPGRENTAGDLRTDPERFFRSLSAREQERVFTTAGAQAIRDGADISRVVNARRRAAGLSQAGRLTAAERDTLRGRSAPGRLATTNVFGRDVYITREGTGRTRGAVRLMPEQIIADGGGNRDETIRLLRLHGYVA